jgi:hypothetical protein
MVLDLSSRSRDAFRAPHNAFAIARSLRARFLPARDFLLSLGLASSLELERVPAFTFP